MKKISVQFIATAVLVCLTAGGPVQARFMQTDPIGYEDGMNMYAYVGNDPMNGTDPSGTKIYLEGESRDRSLQMVNAVSETQYTTDDDGYLVAVDGVNEGGSSSYSASLNAGISADPTGTISIDPNAIIAGKPIDSALVGGGGNIGTINEDQNAIISGNGHIFVETDSSGLPLLVAMPPELILAHEIVQHMVPNLTGNDLGFGLGPDNQVRRELGVGLRGYQPDHPTVTRRFGM